MKINDNEMKPTKERTTTQTQYDDAHKCGGGMDVDNEGMSGCVRVLVVVIQGGKESES